MSFLDLFVIGSYLAAMLALSIRLGRHQQSPSDYYVGGRTLPAWALAVSTMATQSSANSFVGVPAFVALVPGGGLSWLQYELAVPLALLLVMWVLVPVFRGLGLISLYEYLELRFDRATRLLLSAVFLLSRAAASGVALYAASLVVQVATGWPMLACLMAMGVVTVVYDVVGGMRAVVWTDVVQMVVLVVGVLLCARVALDVAGGAAGVLESVDASRLRAVQWGHGLGDGVRAPFWGFLIGGLVLYAAYYGVDQSQVQRQLSAAGVAQARRVLAINALARFPLTLMYCGLGLALAGAWAHSPILQQAVPGPRWDELVPRFIELHLPAGLRGLLVAAVLAAAMSSLDSALNALSAATMRDFLETRIAASRQLLASRLCTTLWGVVVVGFGAWAAELGGSVIEAINRVGAWFYGPLLAAFGCGILDARATGRGVRVGVVAGLVVNVVLWAWLGERLFWMWWNVSGLVAAALVTAWVSRLGAAPAAPPPPGTWVGWRELRRGLVDLGGWAWACVAGFAAMMAVVPTLG